MLADLFVFLIWLGGASALWQKGRAGYWEAIIWPWTAGERIGEWLWKMEEEDASAARRHE